MFSAKNRNSAVFSDARKLRPTIFLTYAISGGVVFMLCTPAGQTLSSTWQSEGHKGFIELNAENAIGAYEHYRTARSLLEQESIEPVAMDLELNMAQALIQCKRFTQAQKILSKLKPAVLSEYKDTLLEARFWRRLRSLHAAQGLFNEAAAAQQHVVSAIGHILGNDGMVSLDERLLLLDYLQKSSQWKEALELASQFDDLLEGRSSKDEDAQRVRSKLYWFSESFCKAFPELAASRSPEYSIALVEICQKFWPHDRRAVDLWNQLCKQKSLSDIQRAEARDKLIALLRSPTWTNINCSDRALLATLLLVRLLPVLLGPNPTTSATLQDINEASALVDNLVPGAMQDSSDLYLQVKSMQAFALSKNSKPQMASDILDSLHPSRSHFKNLFSVSGLLQARRQTAITYKDLGREDLARKQFQAIYKLITTIADPPERKQKLDGWHRQEMHYLSAPSQNHIQQ